MIGLQNRQRCFDSLVFINLFLDCELAVVTFHVNNFRYIIRQLIPEKLHDLLRPTLQYSPTLDILR